MSSFTSCHLRLNDQIQLLAAQEAQQLFLVGTQTLSGDGKVIPVSFIVLVIHSPDFMDEHRQFRFTVGPARSASTIPSQIASSGDAPPRATANVEGVSSEWILLINTIIPAGAS